MIRVLIAEDSRVFQKVLVSCLEKEPGIQIVGIVDNGIDAVRKCHLLRPDLVTMDIFMPKMNGLEATRKIMKECPTRIVIISSMINATNLRYAFEAMHAGAVEVIDKPQNMNGENFSQIRSKLTELLTQTMMAEPEKRFSWVGDTPWPMTEPSTPGQSNYEVVISRPTISPAPVDYLDDIEFENTVKDPDYRPQLLCIGGSTGAPAVISDILKHLPPSFNMPIIIAQHIVKGFVRGMANWLDSSMDLSVGIADDKERLTPGRAVLAPDGKHIGVSKWGAVKLSSREEPDVHVPSVDALFKSVASAYGGQAIGIILSGMGRDGVDGLLQMRESEIFIEGGDPSTFAISSDGMVYFGTDHETDPIMVYNLSDGSYDVYYKGILPA